MLLFIDMVFISMILSYTISCVNTTTWLYCKGVILSSCFDIVRDKGITFVAIDCNWPLVEQGPFHVILHKVIALYLCFPYGFLVWFMIISCSADIWEGVGITIGGEHCW